jgi:hypothetical protein
MRFHMNAAGKSMQMVLMNPNERKRKKTPLWKQAVTQDKLAKMIHSLGGLTVSASAAVTLSGHNRLRQCYYVLQDDTFLEAYEIRSIVGDTPGLESYVESLGGDWIYLNVAFIAECYTKKELVCPKKFMMRSLISPDTGEIMQVSKTNAATDMTTQMVRLREGNYLGRATRLRSLPKERPITPVYSKNSSRDLARLWRRVEREKNIQSSDHGKNHYNSFVANYSANCSDTTDIASLNVMQQQASQLWKVSEERNQLQGSRNPTSRRVNRSAWQRLLKDLRESGDALYKDTAAAKWKIDIVRDEYKDIIISETQQSYVPDQQVRNYCIV